MNKTTMHNDCLDASMPLNDHELDSVSGGKPNENQQKAAENKKQAEALKAFQQALNSIL